MTLIQKLQHIVLLGCASIFLMGCASTGGSASSSKPLAVLHVGGGASHDYEKWFNQFDSALLNGTGKINARYLEPQQATVADIESSDVLLISANKAFPDAAVRNAIFAHAARGKGLVLLHPGLWYNWSDWADYNRILAGGGSRGHDRFGEFEVTSTGVSHPVMKGVPASFKITDELYYFQPDPKGTPIKVLATAHSHQKHGTYPQVFIVEHPTTRIVGLTLGHDGQAHNHPAFQQLLKNSVLWVGKR